MAQIETYIEFRFECGHTEQVIYGERTYYSACPVDRCHLETVLILAAGLGTHISTRRSINEALGTMDFLTGN